jgi:hypothetical protein
VRGIRVRTIEENIMGDGSDFLFEQIQFLRQYVQDLELELQQERERFEDAEAQVKTLEAIIAGFVREGK